jgi:hypothetical protein
MPKGAYKRSIIEKENLEIAVLELRAKGLSLADISREIERSKGKYISQMALSRYFRKKDNERYSTITTEQEIGSNLVEIEVFEEAKLRDLLNTIKGTFYYVYNQLEELPYKKKIEARKHIQAKENKIVSELTNHMKGLQYVFSHVESSNNAMNKFLVELSDGFSPEQRRILLSKLEEYEGTK